MNPSVFTANRLGRDFVIGDLHGQLAMLDALLEAVSFDPEKDRVFSVGDLVDRGQHSAECLERFAGDTCFFAIRGNHEVMMLASNGTWSDFDDWLRCGGNWALSLPDGKLEVLRSIARRFPLTLTLELADGRRVGLVHAEVPPGKSWGDACVAALTTEDQWDTAGNTTAASLVWGCGRFLALESLRSNPSGESLTALRKEAITRAAEPVPGIDLVICGHTIISTHQPEMLGNTLFIDTGAYQKHGCLTMVEPLTGLYWQSRYQGIVAKASANAKRTPEPGKAVAFPE